MIAPVVTEDEPGGTSICAREIEFAGSDGADGLLAGVPVVTWKQQDSRRIDTNALRAAHPDIAEAFSPNKPHRVLRFPKPPKRK